MWQCMFIILVIRYSLFILNMYKLQQMKSLWRQSRSIGINLYDNKLGGIKTALNILRAII